MRLFMAIELNEKVRLQLKHLQQELFAAGIRGRLTRPENMHLTLQFLGQIRDEKLSFCHQVLKETARQSRPFDLELTRVDCFRRRREIVWIKGEPAFSLRALHATLTRELAAAGLPHATRPFVPHITLLRDARLPQAGLPLLADQNLVQPVEAISLMQSDVVSGHRRYRALQRASLMEDCPETC